MKRTISLALSCAALTIAALALLVPARRALADVLHFSGNMISPYDLGVSVPCNGDFIQFFGEIHSSYTYTELPTGEVVFQSHANTLDVTGIGLSGETYQFLSCTDISMMYPTPPEDMTFVSHFMVVGDRGTVFAIHATEHVTINANGDVTADVYDVDFDCLGNN